MLQLGPFRCTEDARPTLRPGLSSAPVLSADARAARAYLFSPSPQGPALSPWQDALARLADARTPSLPNLLASGQTPDGRWFWIQPELHGQSLENALSVQGPCSAREALALVRDLAHTRAVLRHECAHDDPLTLDRLCFAPSGRCLLLEHPFFLYRALCAAPEPSGRALARALREESRDLALLFVKATTPREARSSEETPPLLHPLSVWPEAPRAVLLRALSPQPAQRYESPLSFLAALQDAYTTPHAFVSRLDDLSAEAQDRLQAIARQPNDPLRLSVSVAGPASALLGGSATAVALTLAALKAPVLLPALLAKLLLSGSSGAMIWGGLRWWQRRGAPLGEFWYLHPTFLIRAEQVMVTLYPLTALRQVYEIRDGVALHFGEERLALPWPPAVRAQIVAALREFAATAQEHAARNALRDLPDWTLFAPQGAA